MLCGLGVVAATGCGSQPARGPAGVDRAFALDWHDRANGLAVTYTASRLRLRGGRWSAVVTVHNGSPKALYETGWEPPDSNGVTWYGPALVFSGNDVLGERRLIYLPADSEAPRTPYPLRPGATWRGTIGGRLPRAPALPRGRPIWLRYPMFGIGAPWDGANSALAVQWISAKGVEL
jgi:hypothetical protein